MGFITHAQTQKGNNIDGEAAGDNSGHAISMPDANTVAIGAPLNDGNGGASGHVRVFSWNGSEWLQKGVDIDGVATQDWAGWAVSMPDSNTLAVGAPHFDYEGINSAGHVRIFAWDGSAWLQKGDDIIGEYAQDQSGCSVSMPDANTVAVGALYNDSTAQDAGHVRVYSWNGSEWEQKGNDIDGEAAYDYSGHSVSMPDENTLAVGAPDNDDSGSTAGHVRVFTWDAGQEDWVQKGDDIDGEPQGGASGYSVSMPDANTVAIGAPIFNGNGLNSGHTRVFSWDGSAWVQKGDNINGEAANDNCGHSVSMPDANTLAIGAPSGSNAGHIRVFSWDGDSWLNTGNNIIGDAAGDKFGYSVSMPDANTVAGGARWNDGIGNGAGHVKVYSICNNTFSSISPTACISYTSPSGNYTWFSNGTYMDTIPNQAGCDSIITINLTIITVDVSVTNNSPTLIANATEANYQWLDCDNNYAEIPGENSQSYTATSNGNFAVEVMQNNCVDTSACYMVTNVSFPEYWLNNHIKVYPNPASGIVIIDMNKIYEDVQVKVYNAQGRQILHRDYVSAERIEINLGDENGMYFIELCIADKRKAVFKLLKP